MRRKFMRKSPPVLHRSRRQALASLLGSCLAGCSETIDVVQSRLGLSAENENHAKINRERIDLLPYASISAKIGSGPRHLIVLGRTSSSDLHWIAADRTALVTRYGRLVATAGLATDLRRSVLLDEDPLASIATGVTAARQHRFRRLIDYANPDLYGILIRARYEDLGPETITVSELSFRTRRIREVCETREFEWAFANDYWIDPVNAIVWKSRQHIHPRLPTIEIETLKPAAP